MPDDPQHNISFGDKIADRRQESVEKQETKEHPELASIKARLASLESAIKAISITSPDGSLNITGNFPNFCITAKPPPAPLPQPVINTIVCDLDTNTEFEAQINGILGAPYTP